jgi:hypothetical protein
MEHFTDRLVEKASEVLSGARTTRRNFLIGFAMIGSALVAFACSPFKPGTPISRPGDCPPDSLCNDGFTEFCCTINNGVNACPDGSFPGGWWRADGSSFCGGGTRYLIDCMQDCCGPQFGSFCAACADCTCAPSCDSRVIYCNYFRYGQCHQEIPISGPIVCRVASCTPPYEFDPSCSPADAVDEETAEHTSPCLTT